MVMQATRRVLVVDDDAFLHITLRLEYPDLDLLEAARCREGLDQAVAERPDLIIVDERLPDGSGIDLVRQIRTHPKLHRTPIMVVTAGHDEALRRQVVVAGADEYLPKPIEVDDLRAHIDRLVDIDRAHLKQRRDETVRRIDTGEPGDEHRQVVDLREATAEPDRDRQRGRRRLLGR
jgi:DNA-binding response OmpR family regulator